MIHAFGSRQVLITRHSGTMVHVVVDFDTNIPPQGTKTLDYVTVVFVMLFELLMCACMIGMYYYGRSKRESRVQLSIANACRCIGAGIHVFSTMMTNGHLTSFVMFEQLRNVHCTLWDFLGQFLFGFAVWFFGMVLHQVRWIALLEDLRDTMTNNASFNHVAYSDGRTLLGYSGKAPVRHTDYSFAAFRSLREKIAGSLRLYQWLSFTCVFGVIFSIVLVAEFTQASRFDPQLDACYTHPIMKLVLVLWIFGTIVALFVLTSVLLRSTRTIGFMRHTAGVYGMLQVLALCIVAFAIMTVMNFFGLLVFSVGRCIDLWILMFMYAFSVIRMNWLEIVVSDRSKINIESMALAMTFDKAWEHARLRQIILEYIMTSEYHLSYRGSGNKLDTPFDVYSGRSNMLRFLSERYVHAHDMSTLALLSQQDASTGRLHGVGDSTSLDNHGVDSSMFVLEDDDDIDEDAGVGVSKSAVAASASFDAYTESAYDFASSSPDQRLLHQLDPETIALFVGTVQNIEDREAQGMLVEGEVFRCCISIIHKFFQVRPGTDIDAHKHYATTRAGDVHIGDEDDDTVDVSLEAAAPEPSSVPSIVVSEPSDTTAEDDLDESERASEFVNKVALDMKEAMLQSDMDNDSNSISYNCYKMYFDDATRARHVIPVNPQLLGRVWSIVNLCDESRESELMRFVRACQYACLNLIELFYFARCRVNTGIKIEYQRILEDIRDRSLVAV